MNQKNMEEIMGRYTFAPDIPKECKERTAIIMYCCGLPDQENWKLCSIMMGAVNFQEPIGETEANKIVDQLIGSRRNPGVYSQYIPQKSRFELMQLLTLGAQFSEFHARGLIQCARDQVKSRQQKISPSDPSSPVLLELADTLWKRQQKFTDYIRAKKKQESEEYRKTNFSISLRINKTESFALMEYEKAEHPDEHPLYGQTLAKKKNNAGIKIVLIASTQNGKPAIQIVAETPDGTAADYCNIPKDWMNCSIRMRQNTYHLCISRVTKESIRSQMAYNEERRKRKELPYPQNLISDLIGEYCDIPLSEEQLRCLNIVLEERIPSLDREVLIEHYVNKASLRSIGLGKGLSPERVRQYLVLSLRILRKPENMSLYCPKEDLRQRLEKIANRKKDKPSSGFQFSSRLSNCLAHNSIHTVEALLSSSWAQLRAMRGFGAICERELREYLDANNFKLHD